MIYYTNIRYIICRMVRKEFSLRVWVTECFLMLEGMCYAHCLWNTLYAWKYRILWEQRCFSSENVYSSCDPRDPGLETNFRDFGVIGVGVRVCYKIKSKNPNFSHFIWNHHFNDMKAFTMIHSSWFPMLFLIKNLNSSSCSNCSINNNL